jgi:hypothetical protein
MRASDPGEHVKGTHRACASTARLASAAMSQGPWPKNVFAPRESGRFETETAHDEPGERHKEDGEGTAQHAQGGAEARSEQHEYPRQRGEHNQRLHGLDAEVEAEHSSHACGSVYAEPLARWRSRDRARVQIPRPPRLRAAGRGAPARGAPRAGRTARPATLRLRMEGAGCRGRLKSRSCASRSAAASGSPA